MLQDAGGSLYDVVIPAGTLAAKGGKSFRYEDPTGSLGGVASLVFQPGTAKRDGRLKLKTIERDFSAVSADEREVSLEIALGAHVVGDARPWAPKRDDLVAGKD